MVRFAMLNHGIIPAGSIPDAAFWGASSIPANKAYTAAGYSNYSACWISRRKPTIAARLKMFDSVAAESHNTGKGKQ